MSPLQRRRLLCFALALATIAAGLVLRLVPTGLPVLGVKYGGSALWAAMVYLLLAAALPACRPLTIGISAGLIAALVELTRLYHTPALDAFRLTVTGKLLLGRVFNPWHFLVYWATIAAVAWADTSAENKKAGA